MNLPSSVEMDKGIKAYLSLCGVNENTPEATRVKCIERLECSCNRCVSKKVPSYIVSGSEYLFIGGRPSKQDLMNSFYSPTSHYFGKMFGTYLSYLDIPGGHFSCMNVVSCEEGDSLYCKSITKAFIENMTSVKVIFLLGVEPTQWFYPLDKLSDINGKVIAETLFDRRIYVVPLHHPTTVMLDSSLKMYAPDTLKSVSEILSSFV